MPIFDLLLRAWPLFLGAAVVVALFGYRAEPGEEEGLWRARKTGCLSGGCGGTLLLFVIGSMQARSAADLGGPLFWLIVAISLAAFGYAGGPLWLAVAPRKNRPIGKNAKTFILQATGDDIRQVAAVLNEAAQWLADTGQVMWRADELRLERIEADVREGTFWMADCEGTTAGVMKFQLEDELFWPDLPQGEAAYVHRLAVRRRFAGGQISEALLQWAVVRARGLGRKYLRLDCEASRAKLRAVYERFGFVHHSDRQVGPYFVARYEYRIAEPAGAGTSVESP